jgi:hypothetical protein
MSRQRIVGTEQQVRHTLTVLARAGRVRWMSPPRQTGGGRLVVEVLLADPTRVLTAAPPRARWPEWLPRVDGAWTGVALVGLAVVAGVGWLLWQAVTSTARWATDNAGGLILLGCAAAFAGLWWVTRRFRRTGCAGVAHCNGCTHHRERG